ncbi:hypothetical protein D6833_11725 [Candidatus Parcubacteria bacterium]|nr:MAG: hypothetical protein D6833_11725 [Candidatus Parcubacteria bacterium]
MEYPYTSPLILTDDRFVAYGGVTGTSTAAQRNAAYLMAEMLVSEELGTFLIPTTVTGTHMPHYLETTIHLDHTHIRDLRLVRLYNVKGTLLRTVSGSSYSAFLVDAERGTLFVDFRSYEYPLTVQAVYEAGLSTGTALQPNVLNVLSIVAGSVLNEMIGYGNEAPGDVGVQEFNDRDYRERRLGLIRSTLGQSARVQNALRLLAPLRKHKWVGI